MLIFIITITLSGVEAPLGLPLLLGFTCVFRNLQCDCRMTSNLKSDFKNGVAEWYKSNIFDFLPVCFAENGNKILFSQDYCLDYLRPHMYSTSVNGSSFLLLMVILA